MITAINRNTKWKFNGSVSNASPNADKSRPHIKETVEGRKLLRTEVTYREEIIDKNDMNRTHKGDQC
jgi:hypothetical protein